MIEETKDNPDVGTYIQLGFFIFAAMNILFGSIILGCIILGGLLYWYIYPAEDRKRHLLEIKGFWKDVRGEEKREIVSPVISVPEMTKEDNEELLRQLVEDYEEVD